jgi:hypothetical protein
MKKPTREKEGVPRGKADSLLRQTREERCRVDSAQAQCCGTCVVGSDRCDQQSLDAYMEFIGNTECPRQRSRMVGRQRGFPALPLLTGVQRPGEGHCG